MINCSVCKLEIDNNTLGIWIAPAGATRSLKSALPVLEDDFFPDGMPEKFVCMDCVNALGYELAEALGLHGLGHDVDMQRLYEDNIAGQCSGTYPLNV